MTYTAIVVMAMLCLFIGIETALSIILILIVIGVASHAPILIVLLGVTLLAHLLTKKRK